MTPALSIGLVQSLTDPKQPDRSRAVSVEMAGEAMNQGADIVVLPELCVPGYSTDDELIRLAAEPLEGPTVEAWTDLAREHGALICGGFAESDGDRLFNTAVLVGGDGLLLHYRKLHPFDKEKTLFSPGDRGLRVVEVPWGRVGVCICYDLRFVEVVRGLALKGADLICVPTAWVKGFDQDLWDDNGLCPQAHGAILQANLSQVFIACASQVGRSGPWQFLGSSVLASPFGTIGGGPMPGTSPGVTVTKIDLEDLGRARHRGERIAPREERRVDVYDVRIEDHVF